MLQDVACNIPTTRKHDVNFSLRAILENDFTADFSGNLFKFLCREL
jgi:hypothetical protein